MYLFVCEEYGGIKTGREKTEELILKSLNSYMQESDFYVDGGASAKSAGMTDDDGLNNGNGRLPESLKILRTEKGKPYFDGIPVEFSVSHTDDVWVCLMSVGNEPVGIDIQQVKPYSYDKIAARYYTKEEQEYLEQNGEDGFFRIWTRKEAYAKYTGRGLGRYLAVIDTLTNNAGNTENVLFIDIELKEGIKGACCVKDKGDIWIRKI